MIAANGAIAANGVIATKKKITVIFIHVTGMSSTVVTTTTTDSYDYDDYDRSFFVDVMILCFVRKMKNGSKTHGY